MTRQAVAAPDVSVLMLAYNHERFVTRAVESVLEQRGVHFELLIGDDASSDATPEILERFSNEYPGLVRVVQRPTNLGMFANFADLWRRAQGRHVALLEADDQWSYALKLAAQARSLDDNPHWSMCFHRVRVVDTNGEALGQSPERPEGPFDWERLVKQNFVQTCSAVYRRGVVPELPAWFEGLALMDWPLNLLHAQKGEVGFIDEEWALYRKHELGVWSPLSVVERLVRSAEMLDTCARRMALPRSARLDLARSRTLHLHAATSALLAEGRRGPACRVFASSMRAPLRVIATRRQFALLRRLARGADPQALP